MVTGQAYTFNLPMVKLFRLTYLAKGGGGGGGKWFVVTSPLEILTIVCLIFCLLLTDRSIISLPNCRLKVSVYL